MESDGTTKRGYLSLRGNSDGGDGGPIYHGLGWGHSCFEQCAHFLIDYGSHGAGKACP